MLESLNNVAWSKLQQAHGAASDVPKLIRSLPSRERSIREEAFERLIGCINHQGSAYQATAYAIPFLFELIEHEDVPDRQRLIVALAGFAIGLDSDWLPYDFDLSNRREELKIRAERIPEARKASMPSGPHITLAAYETVNRQARQLVPLLSHDLEDLRVASAFALPWFPECPGALTCIRRRLEETDSTRHRDLANLALAYGLLSHHLGKRVVRKRLKSLLEHPILFVRVSAAIALASTEPNELVVSVLAEGAAAAELEGMSETYYHWGELRLYAEKVLHAVAPIQSREAASP